MQLHECKKLRAALPGELPTGLVNQEQDKATRHDEKKYPVGVRECELFAAGSVKRTAPDTQADQENQQEKHAAQNSGNQRPLFQGEEVVQLVEKPVHPRSILTACQHSTKLRGFADGLTTAPEPIAPIKKDDAQSVGC